MPIVLVMSRPLPFARQVFKGDKMNPMENSAVTEAVKEMRLAFGLSALSILPAKTSAIVR